MKNEIVTSDFSEFGNVEIAEAGELLKAYSESNNASDDDRLGDGINVYFNRNSGYVFLSDVDYNVAMLNDDGKLENFLTCSNCGQEGLRSEVDFVDDYTCNNCVH